mgnify:CR=1 FL=1
MAAALKSLAVLLLFFIACTTVGESEDVTDVDYYLGMKHQSIEKCITWWTDQNLTARSNLAGEVYVRLKTQEFTQAEKILKQRDEHRISEKAETLLSILTT